MDDRIEKIRELQEKGYKVQRNQSMIVNNLYALVTIVVVSIAILLYSTQFRPAQIESEKKALKEKEHQEYLELRRKQIELSHKLNNPKKEESKVDNKP